MGNSSSKGVSGKHNSHSAPKLKRPVPHRQPSKKSSSTLRSDPEPNSTAVVSEQEPSMVPHAPATTPAPAATVSSPFTNIPSHRRAHSQHDLTTSHNTLPVINVTPSGADNPKSVDDSGHHNHNHNHIGQAGMGRVAMNRRSSFNTTVDLPPSMIQMAPKQPILKKQYSFGLPGKTSRGSLHSNAEDANGAGQNDAHHHHHHHHSHTGSAGSSGNHLHRLDRRQVKSSDNLTSDLSQDSGLIARPSLSNFRSNSHNSSLYSRKSSLTSNSTTAFTTPVNTPGAHYSGGKSLGAAFEENGDYFGPIHHSAFNSSAGGTPTITSTSMPTTKAHTDSGEGHRLADLNKDHYPMQIPGEVETVIDTIVPPMEEPINIQGTTSDAQLSKVKKPMKPIDIDATIQKLLDAGYAAKRTKSVCLKNSEILQICQMTREIFLSQPSLLELSPPVKIAGDIHGQYGDLLRLFTKCGFPPSSNYLFLGDYVDRGKQSLETILLLFCYKIKYPENFFLLRGNHECANVTRVYGFYDECKRRCNIKIWKAFIDTFNTMALAAIVAGKIFCVHGGLSPVLNSMDEIRHVSRPTDVPDFGLINDLLWSDPTDSPNEWEDNERGVSYCYNKVAINKFLNKFGFDLVCRAHMVVEDGYEFFNDRSLVTVFSAPNYCGEFDNWGAVMTVSDGLLCSFELLDPLDSAALKQVMKKGRKERKLASEQQLLN
ncbi:salt homeostasis regulator KNAG_0B03580 [Huiozyma naganishii CBS 8797]|uniref:Serine/threonine-protein phosphatase n=1 Tax=Huiozyma naganishii (strain ATCC MYA-139 / BCRC 22969 / CBS 8797 / KCTC 17520 / NBRC 10181 / NCYC 3082 / Yp74L-3) TaxID=1071383 RepID=J7R1W1_HUIN7|nr:hypothetical protein KNAG_0B03580 [Kazachstania naganishii CBS 8797]CCK68800.1 hypothetical protein KNAG_0B03580 [Kazachstania naganishii CBS 8797]